MPVACGNPLVCCAAGSVCGRDCNVRTTTTTIPGGGNCNCYCQDGTDCTGGESCGVGAYRKPNDCGCPGNCRWSDLSGRPPGVPASSPRAPGWSRWGGSPRGG